MADEVSNTPGPFDVERIKSLVALMQDHDLSEIDLHDGAMRIRLRRGAILPVAPLPVAAAPTAVPTPASTTPAADSPVEAAAPKRLLVEIKAPAPGTFYIAPSPDAEPYVRIGSRVSPDTIVGQLEAMKVFTDIPAGCSGVVLEILAENQKAVEHNQVLFRVDPTG